MFPLRSRARTDRIKRLTGAVTTRRRQIGEVTRTAAFRMAAGYGLAFATSALLLFAFIYWQTAVLETSRIDRLLTAEARQLGHEPTLQLLRSVDLHSAHDLHRITLAGLFAPDGRRLAGNLPALPRDLLADGRTRGMLIGNILPDIPSAERVRAVGLRLSDGRVLVLGRNVDELNQLRRVVLRALALGVIPAFVLALGVGAWLSLRALDRVRSVAGTAERIMGGALHERLETRVDGDDFDRLSAIVNRMLDEIERLMAELKAVGENIAHDLRTPLTRVRVKLERARDAGCGEEELRTGIDAAILGLDHTLGIITALLRLAEIEAAQRRERFEVLDAMALLAEVADLYAPIAEERGLAFIIDAAAAGPVIRGDRDLLLEALSNLIGNAIKFTPSGGTVRLSLTRREDELILRIADTGPGIAPAERALVVKPFYRSDKSRHVDGSGLGLSLVAAIARLHGFRFHIPDTPSGCVVELGCTMIDRPRALKA